MRMRRCWARLTRRLPLRARWAENLLLPFPLPFHDGDVAINRQIRKRLDRSARLRPLNLDPIYFLPLSDPKHHTWVVIGHIAPAGYFHAGSFHVAELVSDHRA